MKTRYRLARRDGYHVDVAPRQTVEGAPYETNILTEVGAHSDVSKHGEAIVVCGPIASYEAPVALARRTGRSAGYNRNAHRHQDEKAFHQRRRRIFYALPSLLFVAVSGMLLWGPFSIQPGVLTAQQANALSDNVQPDVIPLAGSADEQPALNYLDTYRVPAERIKLLTIDSLQVNARVLEVGIDGRGQPQLPKNSYDVGWYNVSVLPGAEGAVVLSGACSGSVGSGVFRRLSEATEGARIQIELGDGSRLSYVVEQVTTQAVDALDMKETLRPIHGYDRGLTLIGCTGSYDVATNDFAQRVTVYAVEDLTK